MSVKLLKAHVAFYTSTAEVDSHILKYYTDECKESQAARARGEFAVLKGWWEKQGFNTSYGGWCDVMEPRGIIVGGTFHTSHDYEQLAALIHDYKETFLPDYDDDNIWWGEGDEPTEGYALEHVWVKFNVFRTIDDSNVVRLGAYRRYLDLNIDVAVSNNFYAKGGEDGLPF
jgi:hypothetical protein